MAKDATFIWLTDLFNRFRLDGHEIWLVGGCVRDYWLKCEIKDHDLCTSASLDETKAIMSELGANIIERGGGSYGTAACIYLGHEIEITSFRGESYEPNNRKPATTYGVSLEEDLLRRDFTINAMTMDENADLNFGSRQTMLGFNDLLGQRVLRSPGSASEMCLDDPLRVLRLYRFAHRLDLKVDPELRQAARNLAHKIDTLSKERIHDELIKICQLPNAHEAIREMIYDGVMERIIPGLHELIGFKSYDGDVLPPLEHKLNMIKLLKSNLDTSYHSVLSILMTGTGRTSGHVAGLLKFSKKDMDIICKLTTMSTYTAERDWDRASARKYVRNCKGLHLYAMAIMRADLMSRGANLEVFTKLESHVSMFTEEELRFLLNPKPILDGEEVKQILGIADGSELGNWLRILTDCAVNETITTKEGAVEWLIQQV